MAKPTPQGKAADRSKSDKVKSELLRRGWKFAEFSRRVGLSPEYLTNILCGNTPRKSAHLRIEDALLLPIWSTPEEFAARQNSQEKRQRYASALKERTCYDLAALDNHLAEFQKIIDGLGLTIVCAQFGAGPENPFWKSGDTSEPFQKELSGARAGAMFDSSQMLSGNYFCFWHTSDLAATLRVIKSCFEARGLLNHARLFYIESESGWRIVWPEAGLLIDTKSP
jgi:lambda repressor-like predicted transcriptional regulator